MRTILKNILCLLHRCNDNENALNYGNICMETEKEYHIVA